MADTTTTTDEIDGNDEPLPASASATLDDVVAALATQNARIEQLVAQQRLHGYRTSVLAGAVSVFLGLTFVWGVAQTDWGAKNFAVPVKFFVDSETADDLGIDSDEVDPYATEPADSDEPYATDGFCEAGTSFSDNFDVDCD